MKTIAEFAELLEREQIETLHRRNLASLGNIQGCKTVIHVGKKYTRVDVGSSGKYMIVNDTGEIYGIKAYGVIHKGHKYGTLDTIDTFHWGEYQGIRKDKIVRVAIQKLDADIREISKP